MMNADQTLTYWLKIKLKKGDSHREEKKPDFRIPKDDWDEIRILYEEFEERKRLKKIKFALLFDAVFFDKNIIKKHEKVV